jgi:hypothetical protein
MTKQEIKSEIQKSLDRVPETVLQDVLDFLRQAEGQSSERINLAINLRTILEEDKQLLQRLAQ